MGGVGNNCKWGPRLLPLYPKLIRLHNNVTVHKTAKIITHDMINGFLMRRDPEEDFGSRERLGCVEIMDNVYIGMNTMIMPGVRINKDVIVAAGSVVTSDVPSNTVVQGIPAKPIGKFDVFVALRKMEKGQRVKFFNQKLPDDLADKEWERFIRKHKHSISESNKKE